MTKRTREEVFSEVRGNERLKAEIAAIIHQALNETAFRSGDGIAVAHQATLDRCRALSRGRTREYFDHAAPDTLAFYLAHHKEAICLDLGRMPTMLELFDDEVTFSAVLCLTRRVINELATTDGRHGFFLNNRAALDRCRELSSGRVREFFDREHLEAFSELVKSVTELAGLRCRIGPLQ